MFSDPRKVVFAGVVLSAVAIGAFVYVAESDDDSADDELGLVHDEPARSGRGDIMSGVITSGSVESRSDSAASEADRLHAARKSLLRDDVAAARVQPNAARQARQNDSPLVALKKQADKEPRALAAAPVDKAARPEGKATRTSSPLAVKSPQSRDAQLATRQRSIHESSYAQHRHAAQTVTTIAGSYSASASSLPPRASQPAYALPELNAVDSAPATLNAPIAPIVPMAPLAAPRLQQPEPTVQSELSKSQADLTAQAISSPPLVQTMPAEGVLPKLDSGPKSRAEVRAEIVRARDDGSLPAFGNPDPAGPGGAPSLTGAPRP